MNPDRLAQELPPAVAAWLTAHASADTWDALARDVAGRIARELLTDAGAAAWDWELRDMLRASQSPTVRALVETLPAAHERSGKNWTGATVAGPVCEALGLHGAARDVYDRLRIDASVNAKACEHPERPPEKT